MTRCPCRRRTGEALLRAKKIGELTTAEHKAVNDGCESRDNHRYSTRSCNSADSILSVQNKGFIWDGKIVKIFGAVKQAKNHLFTLAVQRNSENHVRRSMESSDFDTSSIRDKWLAERAVRRVKQGTSGVLLRIGRKMVGWFNGMLLLSRNVQVLSADGKTPNGRRFDDPFKGPPIPFGTIVEYHLIVERSSKKTSLWQESITWNLSWLGIDRGWNLEWRCSDCGSGRIGKCGRIRILASKDQRERSIDKTKRTWMEIHSCRWYSEIVGKRLRIQRAHSRSGNQPWGATKFSGEIKGDFGESRPI